MSWKLSRHAREVMIQRGIEERWIYSVLESPSLCREIGSEEVHFFGVIEAAEGRCLKVVANPQKVLIVTVYFDRKMRKRGCR
jgi:hypothetical protein